MRLIFQGLVEIANEILNKSGDEGIAIATGLKKAREYFKDHPGEKKKLPESNSFTG